MFEVIQQIRSVFIDRCHLLAQLDHGDVQVAVPVAVIGFLDQQVDIICDVLSVVIECCRKLGRIIKHHGVGFPVLIVGADALST